MVQNKPTSIVLSLAVLLVCSVAQGDIGGGGGGSSQPQALSDPSKYDPTPYSQQYPLQLVQLPAQPQIRIPIGPPLQKQAEDSNYRAAMWQYWLSIGLIRPEYGPNGELLGYRTASQTLQPVLNASVSVQGHPSPLSQPVPPSANTEMSLGAQSSDEDEDNRIPSSETTATTLENASKIPTKADLNKTKLRNCIIDKQKQVCSDKCGKDKERQKCEEKCIKEGQRKSCEDKCVNATDIDKNACKGKCGSNHSETPSPPKPPPYNGPGVFTPIMMYGTGFWFPIGGMRSPVYVTPRRKRLQALHTSTIKQQPIPDLSPPRDFHVPSYGPPESPHTPLSSRHNQAPPPIGFTPEALGHTIPQPAPPVAVPHQINNPYGPPRPATYPPNNALLHNTDRIQTEVEPIYTPGPPKTKFLPQSVPNTPHFSFFQRIKRFFCRSSRASSSPRSRRGRK